MKRSSVKIMKTCVLCGRAIRVFMYADGSYRGGHYFFDIPVTRNRSVEYWECPTCYWKPNQQEKKQKRRLQEQSDRKALYKLLKEGYAELAQEAKRLQREFGE